MTRYKKLILKEFLVKFLHTDGDIRTLKMNAFDLENARGRFEVNWCKDMKILNIIQNKSINVEKRKSLECSKVLQLMDQDLSYSDALKTVLMEKDVNQKDLENELNIYI